MHQTHLEIPVSLRPLSRASDAYRPRGIPPSSLASIRVGDGQNLGLDAVMGLSRTPRTSLRVGGFVGGGGLLMGDVAYWCFTQAFHMAAPLPRSEHEDEQGHSSTSGLSKWLHILRESPISSSSSSPAPAFPFFCGYSHKLEPP